ncbi:hypothetical protein NMY22_g3056 [Coprinellus aureogranulatus]|nr:hypothetical protein NMY22_g3056 [Coprinellus aureogranulatus]
MLNSKSPFKAQETPPLLRRSQSQRIVNKLWQTLKERRGRPVLKNLCKMAVPQKGVVAPVVDSSKGDQKRQYNTAVDPVPKNKFDCTKWPWRSNGFKDNYDDSGAKATVYRCLGAFTCTNPGCRRPARPLTQRKEREEQLNNGCRRCGEPLKPSDQCNVKCYMYTIARPGHKLGDLIIWEQKGTHRHVRPPAGSSLTPEESRAVDEQVLRNPNATPLEYRTGDLNPGSVPLPVISPHMANSNAAEYAVKQSKERLGITPAQSTKEAGHSMYKQIYTLNDDLGEEFLIYSRVHGQGVLVFQTKFMRETLEETVNDWSLSEDKLLLGRHGFVTDANMSFFIEGSLLTTCAFSRDLKTFVPVLLTHMLGEDEEHHRPHFEHLFKPIVEKVKSGDVVFKPHLLLNMMDFSLSQRNAHAEEYARAVCRTIPGWERLSPAAQEEQMRFLREEAKAAEKGCTFHFMQQATRIKNALDPDQIEDYDRTLYKMTQTRMPDDDFREAVHFMHREFPDIWGWFSWWLRPSVIGMIFPTMSSTDPDIAALIPKTSNAVEHIHSLLNQATGKNNGILEGIKKTFLLAQKFEREALAIKAGYRVPAGPRERKPKKPGTFYVNDGRGPDTVGALNALEPTKNGFSKLVRLPLFNVMYKWVTPNSCFYDHGLELFFRSYYLLEASVRSHYRSVFPSESYASLLFEHCDLRLQLLTSNKKKDADATKHLTKVLASFQKLTSERIFKKWKPEWDPKEYHCALLWWQPMIEDGQMSVEAQGFFALCTSVRYLCLNGHAQSKTLPPFAYIPLYGRIREYLQLLAGRSPKKTVNIGDYLSEMVLFDSHMGLHPSICEPPDCGNEDCSAPSDVAGIRFSWPPILLVESDIRHSGKSASSAITFSQSFKVVDSGGAEVTYSLSGRIMHQNTSKHFTAELKHGEHVYLLDDMKGSLRKSSSSNPWARKGAEVYWMYTRTSHVSVTSQGFTSMTKNFESFEQLGNTGGPSRPLSIASGMSGSERAESSSEEPLAEATKRGRRRGPTSTNKSTSAAREVSKACAKPPRQVPEEAVLPIPSCASCSVRGEAAKQTIHCDICHLPWHTVCVKHMLPETPHPDEDALLFCCPQCIYPIQGHWDQLMIGTFLLIDANEIARRPKKGFAFYPAQMLSRERDTVTLKWHVYNSWPSKFPKLEPTFTLTAQQCYRARHRDLFGETDGEESFGTILWPLELHDIQKDVDIATLDASDVDGISTALKEALVAISEIMEGIRVHPITRLVKQWMENAPRKGVNRHLKLVEFRTRFSLPLYASHRSLVEHYASNMADYLPPSKSPHSLNQVSDEQQLCATILLELVVLRKYLKLDPSSDAELYEASRVLTDDEYDKLDETEFALRAQVKRELSIHEKAFQSSAINMLGKRDEDGKESRRPEDTDRSSTFEDIGLHKKLDLNGTVPVEHPSDLTVVLAHDGTRYKFGTCNHLWKDHMTLSGSIPRRPSPPPGLEPRPFPLTQDPEKRDAGSAGAGAASNTRPEEPQEPIRIKIPPSKVALASKSRSGEEQKLGNTKTERKAKVQSTLNFAPRSLRQTTMEKRTRSRRGSDDAEEGTQKKPRSDVHTG